MCKCCQGCLESCYWNCFEEKFCYDNNIAYYCEEHDEYHYDSKCVSSQEHGSRQINGHAHSVPPDVISHQPKASKPPHHSSWISDDEFQREIQISGPVLAPNILQAFANSNIFIDENRQKQLKLKEEELAKSNLPAIVEEAPSDSDITNAAYIDVEDDKSEGARSTTVLTNAQSLKSVDSVLENKHLKNVLGFRSKPLAKSSTYLSVPDIARRNASDGDIFTISTNDSSTQLSLTPEIPVIKSGTLPKFFLETPEIGEYKEPTSLNSLKTPDVIFAEFDYSMPRHYGHHLAHTVVATHGASEVHQSLPNIHARGKGESSKRLTQLRQKITPLVIK